jgi:hypothetical protein
MNNGFRLAVRREVVREVMPNLFTFSSDQWRIAFRTGAFA